MARKEGLYPDIWKSGPDPVDHRLYTDCQRARAQAKYRGEDWQITEEQYVALWRTNDNYLNKGRHKDAVCLTRIDPDSAWTIDNVEIIPRIVHFRGVNDFKV